MNVEHLYNIFKEHLREQLVLKLNDNFKTKFITAINEKEESLYLKGEELAIDIAGHCNLCEELTLPLYFRENIPKLQFDIGLNYYTVRC